MNTIFQLNAAELDEQFLLGIKELFKSKTIEISIREINDPEDETEYLMSSAENKQKLQSAIDYIRDGKELVSFSAEKFEEMVHEKSRI
ncbi:MAG: hypothetical protein IPM69_19370 [Ignavibacteria bacterium]|nr:hypothetical protein [Ignavibacteria bacterium]